MKHLLAGTFLALALAATWWMLAPPRERVFFRTALEAAGSTETVTLADASFEIRNGSVPENIHDADALPMLKTAYALTMARRNPIFGIPGANLETIRANLAALDEVVAMLKKEQSNEEDLVAIDMLYPIDFVHELITLEERRRIFLLTGSDENRDNYENQQMVTIAAYARAVSEFKAQLERFAKTAYDPQMPLVTIGGVTTLEHMITMLSELEQGAERAHETYDARRDCLDGKHGACSSDDLALPFLNAPANDIPSAVLPEIVNEIEALKEKAKGSETEHTHVALQSDVCVAGEKPPHYVRVETESVRKPSEAQALYIEDLFFKPTSDANSPVWDYFRERGISYSPFPPLSHYSCPEAGKIIGIASAIAAIAEFAREHSDITPEARKGLLEGVASETAAIAYVNEALENVHTYDPGRSNRIVELALMMRGNAGIESVLGSIAHGLTTNLSFVRKGVAFEASAKRLFLSHSAFPSLFLANDPLSGSPSTPYFLPNNPRSGDFKALLESYSSLRTKIPREKLIHDMRLFLILEQRM